MNVKVSVVVPVYNVEKYFPMCLDSILKQTYDNIEVILIDDGSTDSSGYIADEYAKKDMRVRTIHKSNGGVSSARNFGMDVCTGDYICFVDSDDILQPDYVEYLLNLCIKFNSDISLTQYMFTTFYQTFQYQNDSPKIFSGEDATTMILYYHIPIGCYCKMFRKDFIENYHLRFASEVFVGEGFNFNTACFQRARNVVVGRRKIYTYRRDNETSAMTRFSVQKAEMALYAIEKIRNDFVYPSQKLIKAYQYALWHTADDMYNWMVLAGAQHTYSSLYERCYKIVRNYSFQAFIAPVNKKEKFRAFITCIHPRFMAMQLKLRRLFFS